MLSKSRYSCETDIPRGVDIVLFCRYPWSLARTRAANLGLSAARPSTLRVCARPVRDACRPRAQEASLDGQLSAPRGLRIRAYGSPLTRSASGRVLSPRYAAIWPMAALSGRASVMRHARAAAHTLRVIVRPATLSGLSAHVWASGQGWWQRRTADTKKLRPLVFWYSDSMRMEAPLCSEALRNGSMACRVIRTFIDVCAIASCPYRNRYY